jgi:hypothetical protein
VVKVSLDAPTDLLHAGSERTIMICRNYVKKIVVEVRF